jgi:hypothetical protein
MWLLGLAGCAWVGPDDMTARRDLDGDDYVSVAFGGLDCDDSRADTFPGAAERCDARDQDCDGLVDEAPAVDGVPWYRDADGDGHGDAANAVGYCSDPDEGWSRLDDDCDDTEAAAFPGSVEICDEVDNDCDGDTDDADPDVDLLFYRDADGDGWGTGEAELKADCGPWPGWSARSGDCDDTRAQVNPGEIEICDGLDNDCEGSVDVGEFTWYLDTDGDGYGSPNQSMQTYDCQVDEGWVGLGGDCDEAQVLINPGRPELCNGVDDDCSGEVDDKPVDGVQFYVDEDGDGYGATDSGEAACAQPSGSVPEGGDCDDTDAAYHPGASEDCEQDLDFNCDGFVGEVDNDQDGYPACEDCDDGEPTAFPGGEEVCDDLNIDEDCNGLADDNDTVSNFWKTSWYRDEDGDGYGTDDGLSENRIKACDRPVGFVDNDEDCLDDSPVVNPGVREDCDNGIDDDCDTEVDVCDGWAITTAEASIEGEASDTLGGSISLVDTDGDGIDELMASHRRSVDGNQDGGVFLLDVPTSGQADTSSGYLLDLPGDYTQGGYHQATGDLDADGIDDLVVGLSSYRDGQIALVFGPVSSSFELSGSPALVLEGDSNLENIGVSLVVADFDGDGDQDLGSGANDEYYIWRGPIEAGQEPSTHVAGDSSSGSFGNNFGHAVDLGEGQDALLLSAPNERNAQGDTVGAVYVFHVTAAPQTSDDAVILSGSDEDDRIGGRLATGDLDGDGYPELAVTGLDHYDGNALPTGDLVVAPLQDAVSGPIEDIAVLRVFHEGGQPYVGGGGAEFADFDGDGKDDLVVSAPGYDTDDVSEAGGVFIFYGPATGVLDVDGGDLAFIGEAGMRLGYDLAVGEVDGDGVPDLAVACATCDQRGYQAGTVFFVLGGNL